MATAKAPADHQPKVKVFSFMHEGKRHTLPPASDALGKIPGRALRDAVMDGGEAEIRLGFLCVESVNAKPETLDALYSKSVGDMSRIVQTWMSAKETDAGVAIPES